MAFERVTDRYMDHGDTDGRPRKMQGKDIQRYRHRIDRHTDSMTKPFKIDE